MTMELQPYTEVTDEHIQELTNPKIELMDRSNNGITVRFFWQKIGNICTIYLRDEREDAAVEFVVPNDEVMTWYRHPFAHPDAVFNQRLPLKVNERGTNDASN